MPIPTALFPPSTNSILALPFDSTRKSMSALSSLKVIEAPAEAVCPIIAKNFASLPLLAT